MLRVHSRVRRTLSSSFSTDRVSTTLALQSRRFQSKSPADTAMDPLTFFVVLFVASIGAGALPSRSVIFGVVLAYSARSTYRSRQDELPVGVIGIG